MAMRLFGRLFGFVDVLVVVGLRLAVMELSSVIVVKGVCQGSKLVRAILLLYHVETIKLNGEKCFSVIHIKNDLYKR